MMRSVVWTIAVFVLVVPTAGAGQAYTIDDYNASLAAYGVPFYTRYPASFYTGFAPRVENGGDPHLVTPRCTKMDALGLLDARREAGVEACGIARIEWHSEGCERGIVVIDGISLVRIGSRRQKDQDGDCANNRSHHLHSPRSTVPRLEFNPLRLMPNPREHHLMASSKAMDPLFGVTSTSSEASAGTFLNSSLPTKGLTWNNHN